MYAQLVHHTERQPCLNPASHPLPHIADKVVIACAQQVLLHRPNGSRVLGDEEQALLGVKQPAHPDGEGFPEGNVDGAFDVCARERGDLARVNDDRVRQGMRGWIEAGLPFCVVDELSVHDLKRETERGNSNLQIVDVRRDDEWEAGHVPKAQHIYLPFLEQHLDELDRERPVAVYCGSGYRASIAASLLKRHGFSDVKNVPGSVSAWKAAGYPLTFS